MWGGQHGTGLWGGGHTDCCLKVTHRQVQPQGAWLAAICCVLSDAWGCVELAPPVTTVPNWQWLLHQVCLQPQCIQ
jgi:hypothetical protein